MQTDEEGRQVAAMALNNREKGFITVGGVVVVGVFGYLLVVKPLLERMASDDGGGAGLRSFETFEEKIADSKRMYTELDEGLEELGVRLPSGGPQQQKESFVARVEALGEANGALIKTWYGKDATATGKKSSLKAGGSMVFAFQFETNLEGLIGFMSGLETMERPVVVDDLDIRADARTPDFLKVTLNMRSYVFEESES
jgi:hypothetical protein